MVNDIYNELGQNFIEYAVAVNTDRAIPDAKSGLKPVAKRILYGAYDKGTTSNKPHVKCANIVGEVMAKWHPHGDSSIYGALTRLSQDWVMRYPLIDWHGNNGSRDGDPAASYRYTEARLAKISERGMLANIKKNTIDFIPNYSETDDEPVTLPALFPNLLCNPNTGIGVAMACNWLPHNLNEVAQAIYDYIDGKEPMIPGPDFPTGGLIINSKELPEIIKSGHGSVRLRGKYKIEDNNIVFYELPYEVGTEALMQEIGDACDEGRITGVSNIRNESNRKKGFRLVIECEHAANMSNIISQLFKETNLQISVSYNQVAIIDKTPMELGLKDCIKIYIDHNVDCITREANYDKAKAEARLHIVEGLIKALDIIDDIIALIKKSESSSKAKEGLMYVFGFTEPQAKAILDMKLARLSKLEKSELEAERNELLSTIQHLIDILNHPVEELVKRLKALVAEFGDARRTELTQIADPKDEDKEVAFVEPEKCVVLMTEAGNIKRIPAASFKVQKRNGKGIKTNDDIINCAIRTNTIDSLMVFTNKGTMYRILVNDIPEGTNTSKGTPISALISMAPGEKAILIYSIYRESKAEYLLFTTKNGLVKKTKIEEYTKTKKKTGIAAINIKEGDSLANVCLVNEEPVVIVTKDGYCIKFNSSEVNSTGRTTTGMKGIILGADDEVIATLPVRNTTDSLAVFAQNGSGKRLDPKELTSQKRGGKGLTCYKPTDSTGKLVSACLLEDADNVLIIGDKNSICIGATEIPTLGRSSIGNALIKGSIKAVTKI